MHIELIQGDCLEVMRGLGRVDAVITDPPYGTTGNKWDTEIPLGVLWDRIGEVCAVMTASQPFTTTLIASNRDGFSYCWVWNKKLAGNGILAKRQPLKIHEDVVVFNSRYYPQMRKGKARWKGGIEDKHGTFGNAKSEKVWSDEYYPVSILSSLVRG